MQNRVLKFILFTGAGAIAGGLVGYLRSCVEGG